MEILAALLLFFLPGNQVVRFAGGPIITPSSSPSLGPNINGPSLIRAPGWVSHPLGKYYLYFAAHHGTYIRLAYADHLGGPWKIYEPGTLRLDQIPLCREHVASPDVHVDERARKISMYFHCPIKINSEELDQKTLVAFSDDGLHFQARSQILGPSYFRVFHWGDAYYAITRGGGLYRSKDGVSAFKPGPRLFSKKDPLLRHSALYLEGDTLTVFFSRIGDDPESILRSDIKLDPDWLKWKASSPTTVLEPGLSYEGADLPLEKSGSGRARERERQLRDPAVFSENGRFYLVYSIAGESGLAIVELK